MIEATSRMKRPASKPGWAGVGVALCLLLWAPAGFGATPLGEVTAPAEAIPSRFALSSVGTGLRAAAPRALPGYDLTYNPYLALVTRLSLHYRISDHWSAAGSVWGLSELTHSDSTLDRWSWGDSTLSVRGTDIIAGLWQGLTLDTGMRLRLPTSRFSRARGEHLEFLGSASLSRRFMVGVPLLLRYEWEASKGFTEGTSGGVALRLGLGCGAGPGDCDTTLVSSGVMSLAGSAWQRLRLTAELTSWMSVSFGTGIGVGFLHAPPTDSRISYHPERTSQNRYFLSSELSLLVRPSKRSELLFGLGGLHPQVGPTGARVPYFFNRYLHVYCTARIYVGALLADWLQRSPKVTP